MGDGESLLAVVAEHEPDLAIVDVRMPPTYEDEGMKAAAEIRRTHPGTAVLVLSQHIESRHAIDLVGSGGGFGYLLKDRVLDVDEFLEAIQRVSAGGSALDPEVVKHLLTPKHDDALSLLSPREHEVLGLVAEGRTNAGIADAPVADREDSRDARQLDPRQARPLPFGRRPPPRARGARIPARLLRLSAASPGAPRMKLGRSATRSLRPGRARMSCTTRADRDRDLHGANSDSPGGWYLPYAHCGRRARHPSLYARRLASRRARSQRLDQRTPHFTPR